jgi:hypothetical protein
MGRSSSGSSLVELWANEQETEFGIKVAGEQDFRAITTRHAGIMFERIVDSLPLHGESYDWPYTLDHWVRSRYCREVSSVTRQVAARSHTALLATP